MNNQQLLTSRWKPTDKILRRLQKSISSLTKELRVDILNFFDTLNISFLELNKPIIPRESDYLNKVIREWQKRGINDLYVEYKISKKRITPRYSEYIELVLLIMYSEYMNNVYSESKTSFKQISDDAVVQAEKEIKRKPIKPFIITWGLIEDFLIVTTLNRGLYDYLQSLVLYDSQETYKVFIQTKQIRKDAKVNERALNDLLRKQRNRLINIHNDRESGVMVDVGRELWNRMYIEPYREENVQVRFIAEMDNATTEMCKSMDNMLFYTNDWNRYYRYSDLDGRDVLYTTFGLVTGENLPPINNHFHWCRSTVTYMVDTPRETIDRMLHPAR